MSARSGSGAIAREGTAIRFEDGHLYAQPSIAECASLVRMERIASPHIHEVLMDPEAIVVCVGSRISAMWLMATHPSV
eukprot:4721747-Pleurochrysis_carterae.AAC.1